MDVKRVAVIGSGTMGSGIVQVMAQAGVPVKMIDVDDEHLNRGLGTIERNLQRNVERNRMSDDDRNLALSLIDRSTRFEDVSDADIVIEAVFEDLATKLEVFERLDELA